MSQDNLQQVQTRLDQAQKHKVEIIDKATQELMAMSASTDIIRREARSLLMICFSLIVYRNETHRRVEGRARKS